MPAIEKAGFEPILPITQGSEIIQGHIISNIESSDLVLCDMSIHNPNVFFELGIRTALNKPVCLVKDDITEKVPFDTAVINYHTYSHDLSSWIVKQEIERLVNHINESFSKSGNCNSLWKYLGFKSFATPPERLSGDSEKLEYLIMQIDAMRKQLNESSIKPIYELPRETAYTLYEGRPQNVALEEFEDAEITVDYAQKLLLKYGASIIKWYLNKGDSNLRGHISIYYRGTNKGIIPKDIIKKLSDFSAQYGFSIEMLYQTSLL
ncbi:hypothetical protein A9239_15215 [Methanosarcina sp. A14]|uniref:Uncharacterized protein n=1 Tax=Methanosarcina barkeri MS TaxID=1434108 RepID=A0A0E3QV35_METBA|nr:MULTISPECIES: hypothetical protein [Methanosarcina]AKB55197.1 hypothetical protein MSBRM_2199 [Methanosarcina barkeri MS]OED01068.1 hypothetical protein A9239_15215 [Methanosarcina sp. A14]